MSGPKVIRVVTMQELVARCEAHLRRLDSAIAEWTKACERAGATDPKADEAVTVRRYELRQMLKEGRFTEIQKQVPAEISFLRSDVQTRIERAAAAAAQAIWNRRRTSRTARILLEALERSDRVVPSDLRHDLEAAEVKDSAVARAFALLSPPVVGEVATDRQRELASELGRDEKRVTFADWMAHQPVGEEREPDLRIERHLAELPSLGIDPSPFSARATALSSEPPSRYTLLADSLLIELAQAVREGREKALRLSEMRERSAELALYDSTVARSLRGRIEAAVAKADISAASALIAEADGLAEEEMRFLAADARRRAVLNGLASLGYEVNEGMATAWVQDGQIVLRKAANPDYGVELGGGTKSDRLQVRAVTFGSPTSPRNTTRDTDAEAAWCSEFERLRTLVSSSGGGIEIEHALPVGAIPLKLVNATVVEVPDAARAPRTLGP